MICRKMADPTEWSLVRFKRLVNPLTTSAWLALGAWSLALSPALANDGKYYCPTVVKKTTDIEFADSIDDLSFESEADVHPGLLAILEWGPQGSTSFADHLRSKNLPTASRLELEHLSSIAPQELSPDQWTSLIHAVWDPRRFETDRRVPFLRVRKQLMVPISQSSGHRSPLSVLAERYPTLVRKDPTGEAYVIELRRIFETDNIHFQSPSAPETVLEMHFRFKLPELGMEFQDLDEFFRLLLPIIGIRNSEAHLHVVHSLLRSRAKFNASPANENRVALAWTYWVKLVNQVLDLQDVRLGRTIDTIWDEKTATVFYTNFKAPYFLYERIRKTFRGANPSKQDRVLGHVSFHPLGSYDKPTLAGAEIRNIEWGSRALPSRSHSEHSTFEIQKRIKESFQLEKPLEWFTRLSEWRESVESRGLNPFLDGLAWDHSDTPNWKPSPEYRAQVGAIADDPIFQMQGPGSARAFFIRKKINHSLEMLFHDWCLDPIFFRKPECQAIYGLQRKALLEIRELYKNAYRSHKGSFWSGNRVSYTTFIDDRALDQILAIQEIIHRFTREAKLLERSLEELVH